MRDIVEAARHWRSASDRLMRATEAHRQAPGPDKTATFAAQEQAVKDHTSAALQFASLAAPRFAAMGGELERILELSEKATPGPWRVNERTWRTKADGGYAFKEIAGGPTACWLAKVQAFPDVQPAPLTPGDPFDHNAELIVAMRNFFAQEPTP